MAKTKKYTDDFSDFWKSVELWREQLRNNSSSLTAKAPSSNIQSALDGGPCNDSLNRLENAWQQCQTLNEWPGVQARERAKTMASAPLSAIFCYVEMGLYPPPELLLAAAECYERYIDASGGITLESAFFGKPVQGAGNYASRAAKRQRDLGIAFEMAIHNRDGLTDDAAGEAISLQLEKKGVRLGVDRIKEIANTNAPRVSREKLAD